MRERYLDFGKEGKREGEGSLGKGEEGEREEGKEGKGEGEESG